MCNHPFIFIIFINEYVRNNYQSQVAQWEKVQTQFKNHQNLSAKFLKRGFNISIDINPLTSVDTVRCFLYNRHPVLLSIVLCLLKMTNWYTFITVEIQGRGHIRQWGQKLAISGKGRFISRAMCPLLSRFRYSCQWHVFRTIPPRTGRPSPRG